MSVASDRILATIIASCCFVAPNVHAATIFDGEFFDADWTISGHTTGVGAAAGTFFGANRSAGPGDDGGEIQGNPGAYRHFGQVHGGRQNGTMTIHTMHIYEAFSFDPSVAPLDDFAVSFDAYAFSTNTDGGQSHSLNVGPAIRQGPYVFVALSGAAGNFSAFDQWESFAFGNLTEDDFVYLGAVAPAPEPNFNAAGDAIYFGFYAYNAGNFTTYGHGGVDNWELSIIPVPEPSSALIIAAGACLIVSMKRRSG